MRTWWSDPRLRHNQTDKIALSNLEALQIWQPDLYWDKLVSASENSASDAMTESLFVFPSGHVWRSQQRSWTLACPLNLKLMPFDQQTCTWSMGLYSSLSTDVMLTWRNHTDTGTVLALPNWDTKACVSQWAPTALRWASNLAVYDSGGYPTAEARVFIISSMITTCHRVDCRLLMICQLAPFTAERAHVSPCAVCADDERRRTLTLCAHTLTSLSRRTWCPPSSSVASRTSVRPRDAPISICFE